MMAIPGIGIESMGSDRAKPTLEAIEDLLDVAG
jgi:hypothetical protein